MNEKKVPNKFSEIGWAFINGGAETIRNPGIICYGVFTMIAHWLFHGSLIAGLFGAHFFLLSLFSASGLVEVLNFLHPLEEEEETKENS